MAISVEGVRLNPYLTENLEQKVHDLKVKEVLWNVASKVYLVTFLAICAAGLAMTLGLVTVTPVSSFALFGLILLSPLLYNRIFSAYQKSIAYAQMHEMESLVWERAQELRVETVEKFFHEFHLKPPPVDLQLLVPLFARFSLYLAKQQQIEKEHQNLLHEAAVSSSSSSCEKLLLAAERLLPEERRYAFESALMLQILTDPTLPDLSTEQRVSFSLKPFLAFSDGREVSLERIQRFSISKLRELLFPIPASTEK